MVEPPQRKPLEFVGSAEGELASFPREVKQVMGYALYLAEIGGKHRAAKPLTGHKEFKGAGVLEVVENFDGDTYRAIYTVKLKGVVYVLHAFQKKSKRGAETPKHEIDVIKARLAQARRHYEESELKRKAG